MHKARTVVRSGGLNFDWDERFQLDLLNNMEVMMVMMVKMLNNMEVMMVMMAPQIKW